MTIVNVLEAKTNLSRLIAEVEAGGNLAIANKDPFDRMLIAQSILDQLPLVSNDESFDRFGVSRFWSRRVRARPRRSPWGGTAWR
jgi:PIN domain nuclease of toxin-antitoxin system